ncbi:AtL5 [Hibiscus trionum]|uniref:RING-type E3 ubiquitin transferase n=1 Tax=Hibiscus trionum TaxID=183268 RepID=A0A9W7IRP0_HIBTR|nr:AtL5 [Hibiscus trionum]
MDLQGNHMDYALNGRAMLCTGVVLFIAVLTVLCFHNYVRVLFRDGRRRYMSHRALRLLSISTSGTSSTTVASEGLDSSVIKTIPVIVYATGASCLPPLECAVCLSEFENEEKTRVLPKCNHTFHVDCIDMWFYGHSNCPLCRAPVQAIIPVKPEQIAVPVAETADSEPARDASETESSSPFSSSSSSSSSFEMESCPMQKLELVGIVVEVPARAPCGIGFR